LILSGQYDSPFVRRVAISLKTLDFSYEHDTSSVFADFAEVQKVNPLVRIPSLTLNSGEILIDSGAILDWLDETVGPQRALTPSSGDARREALQRLALATGAIDKIGAANYERLVRPAERRWPDWIDRCLSQFHGGLRALDAFAWPLEDGLDQTQITTGCLLGYVKLTDQAQMPSGRYPRLDALWDLLSQRAEFRATEVNTYAVPHG